MGLLANCVGEQNKLCLSVWRRINLLLFVLLRLFSYIFYRILQRDGFQSSGNICKEEYFKWKIFAFVEITLLQRAFTIRYYLFDDELSIVGDLERCRFWRRQCVGDTLLLLSLVVRIDRRQVGDNGINGSFRVNRGQRWARATRVLVYVLKGDEF